MPGTNPPAIYPCRTNANTINRRSHWPVPCRAAWAVDAEGLESPDPLAMLQGGALLPLGSERERGGHKGTCLAIMVDVLSGVLSGADWGPFAPPFALRQEMPERSVGKGIRHFFCAMRIDAFLDPDEFKHQIDEYIHVLRNARAAPGTPGAVVPGDPERAAEQLRAREGIPLIAPVIEELQDISAKTGIPFG